MSAKKNDANQQEKSSALEEYLLPVFVNVLLHLDLASRFRVAAVNRNLQAAVFGHDDERGVNALWETLNFSGLANHEQKRLNDHQVVAIIKRVKAVQVTKVFRLAGCENLDGTCLYALQGSQVLEQITFDIKLERCQPSKLTHNTALRLFRPMMRRSLYYTNIRTRHWSLETWNRELVPCRKCKVWKYDCALTPCWRCQAEVCDSCADPQFSFNKCAKCGMMFMCLDCCVTAGIPLSSQQKQLVCNLCKKDSERLLLGENGMLLGIRKRKKKRDIKNRMDRQIRGFD